jgi:single-strand DNA-binding protein
MASLNKVMIIGRLGHDPELRYTQSNTAVCNFRVATDESWTDRQSGERKESTEWHRIVVWGRQAETCDRYLSKGRMVFVDGSLRTREWEDRDGNRRWTTEIVARRVLFLDSRGDNARAGGSEEPPPPSDADAGFDPSFSDDEIPF